LAIKVAVSLIQKEFKIRTGLRGGWMNETDNLRPVYPLYLYGKMVIYLEVYI